MSMHKIPLTLSEREGLIAYGLDVDTPSQLSDVFRQGMAYASESLRQQLEAEKIELNISNQKYSDLIAKYHLVRNDLKVAAAENAELREDAERLKYLIKNRSVVDTDGKGSYWLYHPFNAHQVCSIYDSALDSIDAALSAEGEKKMFEIEDREYGRCTVCHRCAFSEKELGAKCNMIQTDYSRCSGLFVRTERL